MQFAETRYISNFMAPSCGSGGTASRLDRGTVYFLPEILGTR